MIAYEIHNNGKYAISKIQVKLMFNYRTGSRTGNAKIQIVST
jgi:hypothetical protein